MKQERYDPVHRRGSICETFNSDKMKKSILIIIVVCSVVIISCDDSDFPKPKFENVQIYDGGGDDDEDPIIEED